MSDWTSSITSGWSIYIIALVLLNVLGCAWLLWANSKRKPGDPAPDQTSRVASIGELGVALQLKAGLTAVVFDPDLSWKIMP